MAGLVVKAMIERLSQRRRILSRRTPRSFNSVMTQMFRRAIKSYAPDRLSDFW